MSISVGRSNRYLAFIRLASCLTALMISVFCQAQQTKDLALFKSGKFTDLHLKGLTVRLGQPVEITEQMGWSTAWIGHNSWSFVHLTPMLAEFPKGNLLTTYALDPDTQANPVFISGFQISQDGGQHWGHRFTMIMQHIPMIFIPEPPDSLMALPSEPMAQTPGDEHNFTGTLLHFEQGGKRMVADLDGFHVENWPWPVSVMRGSMPQDDWHYNLIFTGSCIKDGGQLLATVYWGEKGKRGGRLSLASSQDGGHTWHYYSTIATPDDISPPLDGKAKGEEGPNEPAMIRLADGELMAVFRVGQGEEWHLRRAYSKDDGRTWTKPEVLPAYSVEPKMLRIDNGTIVLSTGRPGIHLWLSTDPRGAAGSWQDVDIVAHHNDWAPNDSYRIALRDNKDHWQTTSYTGLVQVAPNRLLLVYDRDPERAPSSINDISRLFVMPIEVERK